MLLVTSFGYALSAVPSFGECPNVPGMFVFNQQKTNLYVLGISNFAKKRYLGPWYEYSNVFEFYQIGGTCVRATYTDEGDIIGVFNEQVNTMYVKFYL